MGLVYASSESAKLISALNSNIKSSREVVTQLKSGSDNVVACVDGYVLSGAAYTAGKKLFTEHVIPTINKVTTAFEKIEGDLKKYEAANQEISGEEYLNEDILKQQIAVKKAMIASVNATKATVRAKIRTNANNNASSAIVNTLLNLQNRLSGMVSKTQLDINELERKLDMLVTFDSQVSGLFGTSLSNMRLAMQGVLVLNSATVNMDGTYTLPDGVDESWFTTEIDAEKLMSLPNYATTNMLNNGMADETEEWVVDVLAEFGLTVYDVFKNSYKYSKAPISYINGRMFLDGVPISQDSMGQLTWGDELLFDPVTKELTETGKEFKEASDIDLTKYQYSKLPDGKIKYSKFLVAGGSGFIDSVNPVKDFQGWKGADNLKKFGKGMGIVGTGLNVVGNFNENIDLSDGVDGKEVACFASDTAVDVVSGAGAAAIGAAAGSFFLPPLGTIVGAGVGIGINFLLNHESGDPPQSAVGQIKDGFKSEINAAGTGYEGNTAGALGGVMGNVLGGLNFAS